MTRWVAACMVVLAAGAPHAAEPVRRGGFDVETIVPGVQVYRNATAGFPGANSLVVDRADGLLVVDAQPSPEAARALIEVLAKATKKPVRYLVLTNPHVESWGGASAFPESTVVVASDNARARLEDAGYETGAEWRARAPRPEAWREPKRVLPVVHTSSPLTLDDPVHKAVLYPLPRAHSGGDLWVELPGTGVIAVGGLLVGDKNPYGGDCDIRGWIGALNDLLRDDVIALVPSTGPTQGEDSVRRMRDTLAWTRSHVQEAFTDLIPADRVVDHVLGEPGMSAWYALDASPSFARTLVEHAFDETLADRKRRGLP